MSYRAPGQEELTTKVGSTRPTFLRIRKRADIALRFLAPFEYLAEWFFFLFHSMAIFRLVCEGVVLGAVIVTVVGVFEEFSQRNIDRGVRFATLFTQIAQTRALPHGEGLKAVKASAEALSREGVSMLGIDLSNAVLRVATLRNAVLGNADLSNADLWAADLSNADLSNANLSDADLNNANLSDANLSDAVLSNTDLWAANLSNAVLRFTNLSAADLRNADFSNANLSNADFSNANLSNANFSNANLSNTVLRGANNLSQDQLEVACAAPNGPPILPQSLIWYGSPCPKRTEYPTSTWDLPLPHYP